MLDPGLCHHIFLWETCMQNILLGVLLAHSPQLSAASEELKTAFSPKVMEGHDLFYVEA